MSPFSIFFFNLSSISLNSILFRKDEDLQQNENSVKFVILLVQQSFFLSKNAAFYQSFIFTNFCFFFVVIIIVYWRPFAYSLRVLEIVNLFRCSIGCYEGITYKEENEWKKTFIVNEQFSIHIKTSD